MVCDLFRRVFGGSFNARQHSASFLLSCSMSSTQHCAAFSSRSSFLLNVIDTTLCRLLFPFFFLAQCHRHNIVPPSLPFLLSCSMSSTQHCAAFSSLSSFLLNVIDTTFCRLLSPFLLNVIDTTLCRLLFPFFFLAQCHRHLLPAHRTCPSCSTDPLITDTPAR